MSLATAARVTAAASGSRRPGSRWGPTSSADRGALATAGGRTAATTGAAACTLGRLLVRGDVGPPPTTTAPPSTGPVPAVVPVPAPAFAAPGVPPATPACPPPATPACA